MPRRFGSLSLGFRTIVTRLRSQPAVFMSIAVALLVASLLAGASPRLLEEVSKDDLLATVVEPPPSQRDIRVERQGRLGPGPRDDPMLAVRRVGDSFLESEIPPAVAAVVSDHFYLVDSPRFSVIPLPGEEPPHPFPMTIEYRYQEDIEDNMRLTSGSFPAPREPVTILMGDECPDDAAQLDRLRELLEAGGDETTEDLDCQLEDVPVYEIAVTAETADAMGLGVDRMMLLIPDGRDPLFFGISGESLRYRMAMVVSGIVELTDPSLEYWYGDVTLHRPAIQENADLRIIFATGVMSPEAYGDMLRTTGQAGRSYVWRYLIDPERVADSDVRALLSELIPFQVNNRAAITRPTDLSVVTQLPQLLNAHLDQRAQTVALLSIGLAGLAGVVLAVVTLLAVLMTDRQRRGLVLVRNRGASTGQLSMTRFYEALMIAAPAAALGYYAAAVATPGTGYLTPYRFVVGLCAAAVAMMVAAALPLLTRRLGLLQREPATRPRASARRTVAEVLVVVVALGSIVLLRRRGESDAPVDLGQIDFLLAFTPLMIGVASGLMALRVYPHFISLASWIAAKTRGPVGFVGFRRLLGSSAASRLPLAIILICVAASSFSATVSSTLATGQVASSWQVVGSDYAVKGFGPNVSLPNSIDFAEIAGGTTPVFATTFGGARAEGDVMSAVVDVMAVEADLYHDHVLGSPGYVAMPEELTSQPAGAGIGTDPSPLPVLVSEVWPSEFKPSVGDVFTLDLGRLQPRVRVVGTRGRYPDMPTDRPFVVMDLGSLRAFSEFPLSPTVAYLRGSESSETAMSEILSEQAPSARLVSRYEYLREVRGDPFVRWAGAGLRVLFLFAAVFAVVSAVAAVALGSARRMRDFGYLKTLGLETRQAAQMTVIENLPPVVLGSVFGVLVGVGTALILDPSIELDAFTGGVVPTAIEASPADLVLTGGSLLVALTVAVATFVLVSRRQDLGHTLRVGDE